jgi:hypothetical protein
MRPLLEIPGSNEEHQELIELLLANGIGYREEQSSFLMPAMIWVEEADQAQALEIVSSVAARHRKRAKVEWDREWKDRYNGSYVRWLIDRVRKPANLFRLLLLVAVLGVFAVYPLIYIIRRIVAG